MTSRFESVITAIKAVVETALPLADVARGDGNAERPSPGGRVEIGDGTREKIAETFGIRTFTYLHTVELSFLAPAGTAPDDRHAAIDDMMTAAAEALQADVTLGGLVEALEILPSETGDVQLDGGDPDRVAIMPVQVEYTVSGPQGA